MRNGREQKVGRDDLFIQPLGLLFEKGDWGRDQKWDGTISIPLSWKKSCGTTFVQLAQKVSMG